MILHPVIFSFNHYDPAMMDGSIYYGCGWDRIPEYLTPFFKAFIEGNDQSAFFITSEDDLIELIYYRQIQTFKF